MGKIPLMGFSPWPTASGSLSPRGRGLFEVKNYFSHRGRRVFEDDQHTQGEITFWEDGFCDFAFGSAQNDRNGRHIAKSESLRAGETKHKRFWCYAHWLLMQSTLVVDVLCIDVAFIGSWRSVHWTLTLFALLINSECFASWCSVHWLLILFALMLMLSALMLILHSLVADALCIAWRCSAHWFWCCSQ